MKPSVIAPILNAILPGAGLWYLGETKRGIGNLLAAVAVTVIAGLSGTEHIHYALLAIATGSAGYAHAIARSA